MALYRLVFVGISPLMTHNPASMQTQRRGKGKEIPSPEDEAEAGTYRLEDGTCGIPGIAFRNGIVQAGAAWRQPRGRASMAPLLEHIDIEETLVPLSTVDGSPITSFEIDRRRAMVQKAGILRARPKFREWGGHFTVIYDEALISDPAILRDIASDAGSRIGGGDFRGGGKKGSFGRHAIVHGFGVLAEVRTIPAAEALIARARAA
jgi:hypothetical protein